MINTFHPLLDNYAKSKINSVYIDTDSDIISVAIAEEDSCTESEIIFKDVKAFYYIDHDTPSEIPLSSENLNTISFDLYGFGEFSAVNPRSEDELFVSVPKFAVNINESSLFIDADKISINNKEFFVG